MQDLAKKGLAAVIPGMIGMWGIAMALGAAGVALLPGASASCTVNLGSCTNGNCTTNFNQCNGGHCLIDFGFCNSGGGCEVVVAAQCANGGTCLIVINALCSGGSCGLVITPGLNFVDCTTGCSSVVTITTC